MIIGITGTIGAGKGEVTKYLLEHYGFRHFSARDFITQEIQKRGLPVSRDTMTEVANDLRAKHGSSFVIEELYKLASASAQKAVIESVRTVGEIEFLKKQKDFYLVAIDADPKIRFERVVERKGITDHINFEKFLADEAREMSSSDPNKQNLRLCIEKADFRLLNNASLEELRNQIEKMMSLIKKEEV